MTSTKHQTKSNPLQTISDWFEIPCEGLTEHVRDDHELGSLKCLLTTEIALKIITNPDSFSSISRAKALRWIKILELSMLESAWSNQENAQIVKDVFDDFDADANLIAITFGRVP
jgi:hypothetical protein